jgi:hypothetical protein
MFNKFKKRKVPGFMAREEQPLPNYKGSRDKTTLKLGDIVFAIEADRYCKLRVTMNSDPTSKAVGIVLGAKVDEEGRVTVCEGDTFEVHLPIEFSCI